MKFLKKFNKNWCHQSDNSLIENGEDLNSDESEGCWTPIQCAIFEGNVNILRKLIAKGVNVNLMFAEDRFTPLTFAIYLNKVKIVRFLIENGADLNMPDSKGWTPILTSIDEEKEDNILILKLLIEKGGTVPLVMLQFVFSTCVKSIISTHFISNG